MWESEVRNMDKSELIISHLESKMHELDKKALALPRSEFDEYIEIVNQVTFLDELIDEIKRI
ncbi:hypothetical protein [Hathewaya proteolytica]|nr:hypothetical protein [Hathewaya proteolytica]